MLSNCRREMYCPLNAQSSEHCSSFRQNNSFYSDHIDQVKRGLRPRTPRPSGPCGPERPAGPWG